MPRIIHIKNGFKVNTSLAGDGWVEPDDGSQMLEGDERLQGMEWVASTATPEPTPTMRSFRIACGRTLWASIEAVVAGISDADAKWEAQQFLEYSTHVSRNHPLVLSLIAALTPPLTSEQVDTVFAAAISNDDN